MLIFISGCSKSNISETNSDKKYIAGTYTASARGNNGDVVEVVCSETSIDSVTVKEHKETKGISDPEIERIPKDIVENQTLSVDIISGATNTCNAILSAAEECLKNAGGDIEALKTKTADNKPKVTESIEKQADVIVLGGGGAGVSAALATAEEGSSVIIVEKSAALGGNTILAGGGFNGVDPERQQNVEMNDAQIEEVRKLLAVEPKNELHKEIQQKVKEQFDEHLASGSKSLFDSVEFFTLQTYAGGDYVAKLPLVYETCKRATEGIKWLEDLGLKWNDKVRIYTGALWARSHDAQGYKSGIGFINVFTDTIKEKNLPVEIVYEVKADSLISENGRVVGATGKGQDGTEYTFKANKGVVLATGGFSANVEMRQKYNTLWADLGPNISTSNSPNITGDGIIMDEEIGANLIDMGMIQIIPTGTPPFLKNGSGYMGMGSNLYVNKNGERFVNENSRRDVLTKAVFEQEDSLYYIIVNEKNARIDENGITRFGVPVEDYIADGVTFKADTIEELATKIGMDPKVLGKTVDEWNEMCKTGIDNKFGRNVFLEDVWLNEGPFYASPRTPSVHHTMGGVEVDTEMHVINTSGEIIPGLYAAGEVTGGIHDSNRIGANAIPDALANGRVAGINVANE